MKYCGQKQCWGNISRRNDIQNISNNSPSNILWNHLKFRRYCQKHRRCRRHFLEELLNINGLRPHMHVEPPARQQSQTFISVQPINLLPLIPQSISRRNTPGLARTNEIGSSSGIYVSSCVALTCAVGLSQNEPVVPFILVYTTFDP